MEYKQTRMWQELCESPAFLDTLAVKNHETFRALAETLQKRRIDCIYTAARGTSGHAMMYFRYLTESLAGIPVASGAPSVLTIYGGKLRFENALVVACSQSGRAADALEVIQAANACGAPTVSITNDGNSPLAKAAKFRLDCAAGEEKSVAATKTFCAQLQLVRLLAHALAGKTAAAPLNISAEEIARIDRATDFVADDFASAEDCFVLARGVSAALAFECALKLQETCYIRALAYRSSDFYHGPMAMVAKGTKVILFASGHSLTEDTRAVHRADFRKCAEKMEELGADLYVFTDDGETFEDLYAHIVRLPGGNGEEETVFRFALAAQMLACKTSCKKGLDPDAPRALKKITVTK